MVDIWPTEQLQVNNDIVLTAVHLGSVNVNDTPNLILAEWMDQF